MYVVRGKDRTPIDSIDVQNFIAPYDSCVLDIGAGDAKGSIRFARQNPQMAVIALDSSFDALVETSKSSLKKPSRGGATNLLCVYSNIKDTSIENVSDLIRIYLPWGDLLEGIAQLDETIINSIVSCAKPRADLDIVINAEIWKNNLPKDLAHLGEITPDFFISRKKDFKQFGIEIIDAHVMGHQEILRLDTTWTAKLLSSRDTAHFIRAKGIITKAKAKDADQ